MNVNINDNNDNNSSISLLNHTITINDMIDNLYYRTDIAVSKNEMAMKLLYINNLTDNERNNFYYLINAKISEKSKIANYNKPIFKFIDMKYNDINEDYFLDIENINNKNHYIEYKINNDVNTYKIKIYQNENDKYKFNDRDWNLHISYLEPFYSTLKFKIKEERITRNLRNDLNDYKKINDNNYYKLSNDLIKLKNYINRNDINIKYYIAGLYLIIIINYFYK
jgi:hypothetical protein